MTHSNQLSTTEIWVNRNNYRDTRIIEASHNDLAENEIRIVIDKFALTANNVSYAVSGDMIGYWNYFPTGEDGWGKVPVWGMANVIDSNHPDIQVGERINGFFPMASHLVLQPDNVKAEHFDDYAEHRCPLPALYNRYNRCQAEPEIMQTLENERCLLFPLYLTAYTIADFLQHNHYFNAEQIIVGSASSKTGYSLAAFLRESDYQGQVIGLTSPANVDFVNSLNVCHHITTYDEVDTLNDVASVYIDMSGNQNVLSALHHHLQNNMKSTQLVGVTHWESSPSTADLPGVKPEFFFTPGHIDKRNKTLGSGVLMTQGITAATNLSFKFKHLIITEYHHGTEAANTMWQALLDNQLSGQRGIMVSL